MSMVSQKKCNGYKRWVESRFNQIFAHQLENSKILAIPSVLVHGRSYEYGFMKKYDGLKLYAKWRFDRYFMIQLRYSK
ncbi:hypothetical protein GW17_00046933 [Ensete ventricosum]|nr:hypothetical protein GW17_00046933 [Ensete ventricosum]